MGMGNSGRHGTRPDFGAFLRLDFNNFQQAYCIPQPVCRCRLSRTASQAWFCQPPEIICSACYTILLMPMNPQEVVREKRSEILRVAALHGAHNVRLFGSVARGEARENSDVDFLVELEPGRSLLDHAALWRELRELLGFPVDIVEPQGLHWYIRDRVMREARPL